MIVNHLFSDAIQRRSPNYGEAISPEGVILHDTVSANASGPLSWLCNKLSKASCHLLIDRDGTIYQLVPFNREAWHAGKSQLDGRTGVNRFSVGIELVNPGRLEKIGEDQYRSTFGKTFTPKDGVIKQADSEAHGVGHYWVEYTNIQLMALKFALSELFCEYNLKWIWPHWKVQKGKLDTNPLFPLRSFKTIFEP